MDIITPKDEAFKSIKEEKLKSMFNKGQYKKVMIVYPSFQIETGKGRKETYLSAVLPPLGLLYVASQIENAGYETRVIDAESERFGDDQVLEKIKEYNPDLVGIYCLSSRFETLVKLADKIKSEVGSAIFFGGPHPTKYWQQVAEKDSVDIAFIGEAEFTTPEVLACLNNGCKGLQNVSGIGFKYDGKLLRTGEREFFKSLDDLAFPAFHLVDIKKYRPSPQHVKRLPSITMVTSRGCPFRCSFCEVPVIFKGTFRLRSVDNVIAEIKHWKKIYGIKEVQFWDDLFGARREWLEEFLDKMIKEDLDITWSCLTRVDVLQKDLAIRMKQAGCWCIFFGMESLDDGILKAINKWITVAQIEEGIKACKEAGIEIRANFILGCPEETPEKAKKMIKRICELNPDYVKFNLMTPYPGNPLYDQVKAGMWGQMINEDFANMTNHEVVFLTKGYKNKEELLNMRRYAFVKFYFRPRYIFSRIMKLRTWHDLMRHWRGFKLVTSRYFFSRY